LSAVILIVGGLSFFLNHILPGVYNFQLLFPYGHGFKYSLFLRVNNGAGTCLYIPPSMFALAAATW